MRRPEDAPGESAGNVIYHTSFNPITPRGGQRRDLPTATGATDPPRVVEHKFVDRSGRQESVMARSVDSEILQSVDSRSRPDPVQCTVVRELSGVPEQGSVSYEKEWGVTTNIVHVISPYCGNGELWNRQKLFLDSVLNAHRDGVTQVSANVDDWAPPGWCGVKLRRDARSIGDRKAKPFLKDLLDVGYDFSKLGDWILYTNVDCPIHPHLYCDLLKMMGCVVEYVRRDVYGVVRSLPELYVNDNKVFAVGVDGLAVRSQYYMDVKDDIPDMLIGEPHWDTVCHGLFRNRIPTRMVTNRLFHPAHAQSWGGTDVSAGERHNESLYQDALSYGLIDKSEISIEYDKTDTAIIIVCFGDDKLRWESTIAAFQQQLRQDLYADFYFIELLYNDAISHYPRDVSELVEHVMVTGGDDSKDLWQKECLMNIGWKEAAGRGDYKYFIFIDSDIYANELDWFRSIRQRLVVDSRRAVQGFRLVEDTKDPHLNFGSLASAHVLGYQVDLPINPGMCWGISRRMLESGNGFNPYFIDGGGDSGFVAEYLNNKDDEYDISQSDCDWFEEIVRTIGQKAIIDCVPYDIIHVNHGMFTNKNYTTIRYAMHLFNKPLLKLIQLNENGLLSWIDPDCVERKIMKMRPQMHTTKDVEDIFDMFGYKWDKGKRNVKYI